MKLSEPKPDEAGRQSRPIQPRRGSKSTAVSGEGPVVAGLPSAEVAEKAERLERLLADAELISRLQLAGFDPESDVWRELAHACAEYGYGVFVGWGRSGALRRMAQQHGRSGVYGFSKIPEGLRLSSCDAHELAAELVIKGIDAFRTKTLMHPDPRRRWRPEGGAALRTYFIGRCLMELPLVYETWAKSTSGGRSSLVDDHDAWAESASTDGYQRDTVPDAQAVALVTIEDLRQVDGLAVTAFELQGEGYSYVEIVQILTDSGIPVTEPALRTRMSRLRQRMR